QMALDRSPCFVLGALLAQLASRADFLWCSIITAHRLWLDYLLLSNEMLHSNVARKYLWNATLQS
ncbi:MAG: hypothetical protein WCD00_12445, partial [Desulfuromonadaceae bacterium]